MLQLKFNEKSDATTAIEAELPLSIEQPDVLRTGLKENMTRTHVSFEPSYQQRREDMLRDVARQYGIGAAIRRQADLKVVEQFHRFPGLKSSFVGLEIELGEDIELRHEDWLGDVNDSIRLQCDLHATMQKHLGME